MTVDRMQPLIDFLADRIAERLLQGQGRMAAPARAPLPTDLVATLPAALRQLADEIEAELQGSTTGGAQ